MPAWMHQQEKESQKKKREKQKKKLERLAGGKKGEQDTGKITKKKFVPKENKPLPTMDEILKKQREKKKKKTSSVMRGRRGRDETLASFLGNRKA
jgi:hypothetical protein